MSSPYAYDHRAICLAIDDAFYVQREHHLQLYSSYFLQLNTSLTIDFKKLCNIPGPTSIPLSRKELHRDKIAVEP